MIKSIYPFSTTKTVVWLLCVILTACQSKLDLIKLEGQAQGTEYHISYFAGSEVSIDSNSLHKAIKQEFERIDAVFSNYRNDSLIEQFNQKLTTDSVEVNAELIHLIEKARPVYADSLGCFDLTIKPLFDLWGFKKDIFTPPDTLALKATLQNVGMNKIIRIDTTHLQKMMPETRVDVSAVGQGYSVGKIATLLESHHIQQYLVEIGGELQIKGLKPDNTGWKIALEKPLPNERTLHKIVHFESGEPMALMTSGTYRHYFDAEGKRYSHILDARTGHPVEHNTVSVTVLHTDATLADAWSTALLCLGQEAGLTVANQHHIAAFFIQQQKEALIESASEPWQSLKGIEVLQP